MPEGVVSSRSTSLTSALSPKGLNFIYIPPLVLALLYDAAQNLRHLLGFPAVTRKRL
jgi:hypothetical protein